MIPKRQVGIVLLAFTFHSGYIPIGIPIRTIQDWEYFTFHSGYIPISVAKAASDINDTLHSILDIFQCKVCFRNLIRSHPLHSILVIFQFIFMISYYFFTIFTFHSGYILIFQIFRLSYSMPLFTFHPCVKYWIHIFSNFQSTFLLYFNFKIGFFKSLFIRSAYTTWSTTSDIVVILCPASLEDAPQWYILCLSVFQSMIIYLSWNSPPDF